ncbi:MAG: hypothetical protein M3464_21055 [Chloroflexota bacterium]|nr:hypothetical protein [Chloroflexota bacterium]
MSSPGSQRSPELGHRADAAYRGEATLRRLAVSPDQVTTFVLPMFSAHTKEKDARYRWFLDRHGVTCCELDALDPNVLRRSVAEATGAVIDWPRWHRAETVEHADLRSLSDFLTGWPGAA